MYIRDPESECVTHVWTNLQLICIYTRALYSIFGFRHTHYFRNRSCAVRFLHFCREPSGRLMRDCRSFDWDDDYIEYYKKIKSFTCNIGSITNLQKNSNFMLILAHTTNTIITFQDPPVFINIIAFNLGISMFEFYYNII